MQEVEQIKANVFINFFIFATFFNVFFTLVNFFCHVFYIYDAL